jgi:hypothetical protein
MAPISQREARRLMKRVAKLETMLMAQRSTYSGTYPGGTHIESVEFDTFKNEALVAVKTARRLRHVVVAVENGKMLQLYALPHPSEPIN